MTDLDRVRALSPAEAELAEAGEVTAEEAREIAQRFIDGHFGNAGREGPRISIPANPRRDDDLRLSAFINQAERDVLALKTERARSVLLLGIIEGHERKASMLERCSPSHLVATLSDDGVTYTITDRRKGGA